MPNPTTQLDEDAVRLVLSRALELQRQQGDTLTEAQVRAIARELSIPDGAIEQALTEYRSGAGARTWWRGGISRWPPRFVVLGLLGIALLVFVVVVAVNRRIAVPTQ